MLSPREATSWDCTGTQYKPYKSWLIKNSWIYPCIYDKAFLSQGLKVILTPLTPMSHNSALPHQGVVSYSAGVRFQLKVLLPSDRITYFKRTFILKRISSNPICLRRLPCPTNILERLKVLKQTKIPRMILYKHTVSMTIPTFWWKITNATVHELISGSFSIGMLRIC